ncbi:MAG: UbiX family flavin prenyltransferase [Bacteroidia bacterium]|nr:UbiX family flavin prenyltransferase [Bacteroidia bacterium]
MITRKLIIGITGASGSLYAHLMLTKLRDLYEQLDEVAVVVSDTAEKVWEHELPDIQLNTRPFIRYPHDNFFAPLASGSAGYDAMIIIPCSVGTLGRIAAGTAEDLISRAADVIMKEHKKLILVLREAPYSRIHLQNMLSVTDAGGIICPATPGFYHNPSTINELCSTVVTRALSLAGVDTGEKGFMVPEAIIRS